MSELVRHRSLVCEIRTGTEASRTGPGVASLSRVLDSAWHRSLPCCIQPSIDPSREGSDPVRSPSRGRSGSALVPRATGPARHRFLMWGIRPGNVALHGGSCPAPMPEEADRVRHRSPMQRAPPAIDHSDGRSGPASTASRSGSGPASTSYLAGLVRHRLLLWRMRSGRASSLRSLTATPRPCLPC